MTEPLTDLVEELARVIADALGDNYSDAFKNKERWVAKRGISGGRFRDVNEPFRCDYEEAARAVLESPIITREIDRAKAEGWRPIETAPRDGTWILIRGRNSANYPMIPVVCRWSTSVHGSGPATWRDSGSDRDMSNLVADVPPGSSADWLPLPQALKDKHDDA